MHNILLMQSSSTKEVSTSNCLSHKEAARVPGEQSDAGLAQIKLADAFYGSARWLCVMVANFNTWKMRKDIVKC